jgi:2-methylcitrate dehydratase PrpD
MFGMKTNQNSDAISRFVYGLRDAALPADVQTFAKQSLIDWFAVCLAASKDPEAVLAATVVHGWRSKGRAVAVDGRSGSSAPIALVNATYSHALDYDDFHIGSVHHGGGPTFASALALAMDRGRTGEAVLRAFAAGFEVGTHLGMNGRGLAAANAGWHPTCVLGHLSSAAAGASLLELDRDQIARALGFAAAQVGGLMASAGTIAKPFLVGKSAFAGVLSCELAEGGASVPDGLLEGGAGLFAALLQEGITLELDTLGVDWQILRNTFKPYSACQLTHAAIDAAKVVADRVNPDEIASVRAYVNPFAVKIAGYEKPVTPLQARFSLKHCIAMTLLGHGASPGDFTHERVADARIVRLRDLVEIVPTENIARTSGRLEARTHSGALFTGAVPAALGSLERPMSIEDTKRKFLAAASLAIGDRADSMLDALMKFEQKGAIEEVTAALSEIRLSDRVDPANGASASR